MTYISLLSIADTSNTLVLWNLRTFCRFVSVSCIYQKCEECEVLWLLKMHNSLLHIITSTEWTIFCVCYWNISIGIEWDKRQSMIRKYHRVYHKWFTIFYTGWSCMELGSLVGISTNPLYSSLRILPENPFRPIQATIQTQQYHNLVTIHLYSCFTRTYSMGHSVCWSLATDCWLLPVCVQSGRVWECRRSILCSNTMHRKERNKCLIIFK